MDQQRPLLYLTLLFLGFMIWTTWQADKAPKPVKPNTATQQQSAAGNTSSGDTSPSPSLAGDVPQQTSAPKANTPSSATAQSATSSNQASIIRVKTDVFDIKISTRGGDILETSLPTYPQSLETPDKPVAVLDESKHYSAQSGLVHNKIHGLDTSALAPTHHNIFQSTQSEYTLGEDGDTLVVPLVWNNGKGITVTKRYIFKRGEFAVNVEQTVSNKTAQIWSGFEYRQLTHAPAASLGGLFSGVQAYIGAAYYDYDAADNDYVYRKIDYADFNQTGDQINKKIVGGWAAMLEHYFVSAWVPQQDQETTYNTLQQNKNGTLNSIFRLNSPVIDIAQNSEYTFKSVFYAGPKIQENLEKIANGLELTVDYGIFTVISKPIFTVLKFIHSYVGNWGWAIILITVLIKLLFFWPSAVSYRSMAKMKKLAPKMKEMQERTYNDPQAKQKAMMEFYKKEKINPLGGCLPMLIQIPVFMGLYWVLLESVELRQAPWILWYQDLSNMDPTFILPLLMGASMYLQQKLNPPQMDPMQQKIFTWLPVVFTFLFLFFPAGLVLYWVVNNVLSIAQQWFINKRIIGE